MAADTVLAELRYGTSNSSRSVTWKDRLARCACGRAIKERGAANCMRCRPQNQHEEGKSPRLGHLPSIAAGIARRELILAFLRRHQQEHGYAPSMREIAEAVNVSLTTVLHQLDRLEVDGLISRDLGIARSIRVLA